MEKNTKNSFLKVLNSQINQDKNISCVNSEDKRRRIEKAYRSNQNSTSKTKLFLTAEKIQQGSDLRAGIRSSDKYKETRCSRKN